MVADLSAANSGAMPRNLALALLLIDGGMLLYWTISGLAALGLLNLPPDAMYAGYGMPMVAAWNWSFLPLDLLFSLSGLVSVRLARANLPLWRPMAIISLTLTFCAGLMAVAFWALIGFFDLGWWLSNLVLMIVPGYWLLRIVRA